MARSHCESCCTNTRRKDGPSSKDLLLQAEYISFHVYYEDKLKAMWYLQPNTATPMMHGHNRTQIYS